MRVGVSPAVSKNTAKPSSSEETFPSGRMLRRKQDFFSAGEKLSEWGKDSALPAVLILRD